MSLLRWILALILVVSFSLTASLAMFGLQVFTWLGWSQGAALLQGLYSTPVVGQGAMILVAVASMVLLLFLVETGLREGTKKLRGRHRND